MGQHRSLAAHLTLTKTRRGIVARVTLRNTSPTEKTFLVQYNLPYTGKPYSSLFRIEPSAKYIGFMAKRPEVSWEDLEPLEPGEARECETILEDSYRLPQGTIRVWYSASHDNPDHPREILSVTSNVVEIET